MNFKDVYKEANDELCGSGALLDKILSAPVKKPFRIPTVVPVIAVAAMIAVIVAVPKLSERSLKGALKTDVVLDNTPVVVAEAVKEETFFEETPDRVEPEPAPAFPVVTEDTVVADEAEAFVPEAATDDEAVVIDEAYEATVAVEPASEDVYEDIVNINYAEQLAGAEASVMSRGVPENPVMEMTAEEYSEYIGKDIAAVAVIPEDMVIQSPEVVIIETDDSGEFVKDKATYFAHSGDYERFAEINVTRSQDILIPGEGLDESVICGNPVVIVSDNTDYNASFSENDVQYFIRTGGVTEDELKNLLISLNGGSTND